MKHFPERKEARMLFRVFPDQSILSNYRAKEYLVSNFEKCREFGLREISLMECPPTVVDPSGTFLSLRPKERKVPRLVLFSSQKAGIILIAEGWHYSHSRWLVLRSLKKASIILIPEGWYHSHPSRALCEKSQNVSQLLQFFHS